MGECLIRRRNGNIYELPVLNASYPQDKTVNASSGGTATFSVQISEHGKPAEYTYQWYVNGSAVNGATSTNYTRSTTSSNVGTFTIYCKVTNKAGSVNSRAATLTVKSGMLDYSYTGQHEFQKDGEYAWTLRLLSSGKLTLVDGCTADIFLSGGGGGGGSTYCYSGGSGGAGGYQTTKYAQNISSGSYNITIGGGGSNNGSGGQTSGLLGLSANGGGAGSIGYTDSSQNLGSTSGTGAGGNGGSYWDGGNQGNHGASGSDGKRAFGSGSIYYGAGGGGGASKYEYYGGSGGNTGGGSGGSYGGSQNGGNGQSNTGSGGGGAKGQDGGSATGGTGGSGIMIIRSAR